MTECGSVGFCGIGAAVMVYPDGVWYAQVREGDVAEIVEEHLLNGRVVERLALLRIPSEGKERVTRPTNLSNGKRSHSSDCLGPRESRPQ